jgi:hypothetical protein
MWRLWGASATLDISHISPSLLYAPLDIVPAYLCHTFHNRRSGVGLAVVNGQLFAVGGFDGTTYLKTIEASIKSSTR